MIWATVISRSCFGWLYRASPSLAAKMQNNPGIGDGTGKPGVLQSVGLQRVRHNWVTKLNWILMQNDQSAFSTDHLMMSMCKVVSCAVGSCLLWPGCSLGKIVSLLSSSFCTPKPNLPITPCISWVPIFAFQSPMKSFLLLVLEDILGFYRTSPHQLLQHQWLGHRFVLLWCWMVCLRMNWDLSDIFEIVSK